MDTGQVAIVTGASRGIGAASAVELARAGYRVVVNYHSRVDAAQTVIENIRAVGGDGVAVRADVRDPAQAELLSSTAIDAFGRLDVLVCAAASAVRFQPFAELKFEKLATEVSDELAAAFHPVRAAVSRMVDGDGGRLVLLSSQMTERAPFPGGMAHGVAKSALNTFVRYLAVEYGPSGVTANIVSPSYVRTDNSTTNIPADFERQRASETPLGRVCLPEDVARVVVQLAAPEFSYVTGHRVPVTGGHEIR